MWLLYLKVSTWAVTATANKVANNNISSARSVNKGMAFATGESLWNVCLVNGERVEQKAVRVSPAV